MNEGFRLCSCDGEALADPDWILESRDHERPQHHRRGRVASPRFTEAEQKQRELLLEGLQGGACFDFTYTPTDGDVLRVRAGGRWYRFLYEREKWKHDRSSKLTGWRSQMVERDQGVVR